MHCIGFGAFAFLLFLFTNHQPAKRKTDADSHGSAMLALRLDAFQHLSISLPFIK